MSIELRNLARKDEHKAIQFAIVGMHFDWYVKNKILLEAYGRYFWYEELNQATQVIAAYEGSELAGVLLARIDGQAPVRASLGKRLYVGISNMVAYAFFKESEGAYNNANARMLAAYQHAHTTDGELCFLAANPKTKTKGIGTALIDELARRAPGKHIYLYTDSACTYQFYDHRGFKQVGREEVSYTLRGKHLPMTCFLYAKTL